jgi:hypothetical protein
VVKKHEPEEIIAELRQTAASPTSSRWSYRVLDSELRDANCGFRFGMLIASNN